MAAAAAGDTSGLQGWPRDLLDAGWRELNLGRSLLSPQQAFLHAVFLGALWALLLRRFWLAFLLCALLSASDATAGLQLLLVVLAWALVERGFLGDTRLPVWFPGGLCALLTVHLGYYHLFLPRASWEHAMTAALPQSTQTLTAMGLLGGYVLIGAAALVRLRNRIQAAPVLQRASGRLLLVWLAVSFLLANHEFLIPPQEPLRFARGHLWLPLFLIGAPVLAALLDRLWAGRRRAQLALALLLAVFLFDNATFLTLELRAVLRGETGAHTLTRVQRQVIAALDDRQFDGYLVAAPEAALGYMTTVYTPLRSWYSHDRDTPAAALRRDRLASFLARGIAPSEWLWDDTVVIIKATPIEAGRLSWLRHGMTIMDAPGPYVFVISPSR